jgi:hypothetical protein
MHSVILVATLGAVGFALHHFFATGARRHRNGTGEAPEWVSVSESCGGIDPAESAAWQARYAPKLGEGEE